MFCAYFPTFFVNLTHTPNCRVRHITIANPKRTLRLVPLEDCIYTSNKETIQYRNCLHQIINPVATTPVRFVTAQLHIIHRARSQFSLQSIHYHRDGALAFHRNQNNPLDGSICLSGTLESFHRGNFYTARRRE